MKNILVISDPIEKEQVALEKAQVLARTTVANIHVVAFCYESLTFTNSDDEDASIKSMVLSRAKQFWENIFTSQDMTTTATYEVVWEKNISQWVHKHCETVHYDLIVKSGHRSETTFHTPTDWQLFRESNVPVYCVSNQSKATDLNTSEKTVLVALDFVTQNKEKLALNRQLLEAGFQLSIQTNANLRCCSAIVIPRILKDMDLIDVPMREAQVKDEIQKKAELLFDDYDIPINKLTILQGNPWTVIINTARLIKADCIVLGSMGRSHVVSKLIGNTAEKVIHYSESDLLVISPKN